MTVVGRRSKLYETLSKIDYFALTIIAISVHSFPKPLFCKKSHFTLINKYNFTNDMILRKYRICLQVIQAAAVKIISTVMYFILNNFFYMYISDVGILIFKSSYRYSYICLWMLNIINILFNLYLLHLFVMALEIIVPIIL